MRISENSGKIWLKAAVPSFCTAISAPAGKKVSKRPKTGASIASSTADASTPRANATPESLKKPAG